MSDFEICPVGTLARLAEARLRLERIRGVAAEPGQNRTIRLANIVTIIDAPDGFSGPTDSAPAARECGNAAHFVDALINGHPPAQGCPTCSAPAVQREEIQYVATRGGRAAICGIPATDHDCDAMGCPSTEHILYRVPHVRDEQADSAPAVDCPNCDLDLVTEGICGKCGWTADSAPGEKHE